MLLAPEVEKTFKITNILKKNNFFAKNAIQNQRNTFSEYFLSIHGICSIENNILT